MLVEVEEVVALQELVGKLREGQSVACCPVKALLHAFLCHHVVDGDVLSHLTGEVEEGEVLHPVVVVDHLSPRFSLGVEIQEFCHLRLDALLIVTQCLVVEQVSFLTLPRGVANHTRGTAYENDGLVTATLQVTQHHDATKVSDVEGIGRWVCAEIGRDGLTL